MFDKRLLGLLSRSKKYIVQTVLFQWITMLMNVIVVFIFARSLNSMRLKTITGKDLIVSVLMIAACITVRVVCQRLAARSSYLASGDVKKTLREKIYLKLLSLGNSYQEHLKTSELVQVSMEGVEQLEIYFGKYMPQLFYSLLAPLTLFFILAPINFRAAIILFLCVPLIPISIVAVQKFAKKLLSKYWGKYTGLGDSFLENLQGLTTLKIYQADERKTKEMDEQAENFRKVTMKVLMMQLNSISVMDLVAFGGAAVGILVGILEFQKGRVGFDGMLIIILLSSEFFIPMRLLGSFFHIAMNGMAASDKIFQILELKEGEKGKEELEHSAPIIFENVDFSYDESRQILHQANLTIHPGQFVAIAGVSGSGKSTIAGILTKKNMGYSGNVFMGDQKLKDIMEEDLHKKVALVTHNGYLFAGTVKDNLILGKPDATKEEMLEVLKQVNLYEFLQEQEGLDTILTEQGNNLSGGQRQRLVLARALLLDAPVYIFDEATSNIDVESESDIIKIIHNMRGKKTVIMISHRLENVVPADCIYHIESGKITGSGTHDQLIETDQSYKTLYEAQQELEQIRRVGA